MPPNIPEDEDRRVLVMVVKGGHVLASKIRHQKELLKQLFPSMIPRQMSTTPSVLASQVVCIGLKIKRSGPRMAAR